MNTTFWEKIQQGDEEAFLATLQLNIRIYFTDMG